MKWWSMTLRYKTPSSFSSIKCRILANRQIQEHQSQILRRTYIHSKLIGDIYFIIQSERLEVLVLSFSLCLNIVSNLQLPTSIPCTSFFKHPHGRVLDNLAIGNRESRRQIIQSKPHIHEIPDMIKSDDNVPMSKDPDFSFLCPLQCPSSYNVRSYPSVRKTIENGNSVACNIYFCDNQQNLSKSCGSKDIVR